MPPPLTNASVRAKYGCDFAHEYARLKTRLQMACSSAPQLAPLQNVLGNDVFEMRVFQSVVQWFEDCLRQGKLPPEDQTRHQILFHISRELTQRGFGPLVNSLAKAYVRKP